MALDPFPVDESVQEEGEVAGEIRNLRLNRFDGPSRMQAEHLRARQRAAKRKESLDPSKWVMVVGLVQAAFRKGSPCGRLRLAYRCPDPKEERQLLKHMSGRGTLEDSDRYSELPPHNGDSIPRRSVRGTGTASLKANLLQQLMNMGEKVLYEILFDIYKAYDDLD